MEPDYSIHGYIADRRSRLRDVLKARPQKEHYGQRGLDHPIMCHTCGFQERAAWSLGQRCPKCESEQFFPKVKRHIDIQKWKRMGICLGLVLFIMYGIGYTANKIAPAKVQVTRILLCTKGDHVFQKEVDYKAQFPVSCDRMWHFGKTAYQVLTCDQGHAFPHDFANALNVQTPLVCPKCQSSKVRMMSPKDI